MREMARGPGAQAARGMAGPGGWRSGRWGAKGRPTLPSPDEEAILRSCSCSAGSEAYWASS